MPSKKQTSGRAYFAGVSGPASSALVRRAYSKILSTPVPETVRRKLAKDGFFSVLKSGDTFADLVAISLVRGVVRTGNPGPARELREAIEGKAAQRFEIGPDDRKIEIVLVEEPLPDEIVAKNQKLLEANAAPADVLSEEENEITRSYGVEKLGS